MTEQAPRTAAEWKEYGERMARAKAANRRRMAQKQPRPNPLLLAVSDDWTLTFMQLRSKLSGPLRRK
jgi:hypothetical protein